MKEFLKFYLKENISQEKLREIFNNNDIINKIDYISNKYNIGTLDICVNIYLNKTMLSFHVEESKIKYLNNMKYQIENDFLKTLNFIERIPLTKSDLIDSFVYLFNLKPDQFDEIIKVFQSGDLFEEKNVTKIVFLKNLFYENIKNKDL